MESSFSIRRAQPTDAPVLCELIHALAEFERLAHEARPDAKDLARQLAAEASPPCGAFIAEESSGRAAGFALFYFKYSTFLTDWGVHLEDLFVRPDSRRRGIGTALMKAVAQHALSAGCRRLELSVLDWNREAIAFYREHGGRALDDWTTFRFTGDSLRRLALGTTEP